MTLEEAVLRSKLGIKVKLITWRESEYVTHIEIRNEPSKDKFYTLRARDEENRYIHFSVSPWNNVWRLHGDK